MFIFENNSFKNNKLFNNEIFIILLLVLFTIVIRFITVTPIEDSGDGLFYWEAAKKITNSINGYRLVHWTTRFGLIFPVVFLQKIFGTSPIVYFSAPFAFSIIQTIFIYKLVRLFSTRFAGILAAILMVMYPQMVRSGTQLLPEIFSSTYITISIYYLVLSFGDKRKNLFFIISAVAFFFAYLTKETNLFFLPGMYLSIYLNDRKLKRVVFYGGVLLSFFAIELMLYYFFTGDPLARINGIIAGHLENENALTPISFWMLIFRFIKPGPQFILIFILYLFASWRILKESDDTKIKTLIFASLSYYFFLTFTVKSIFPLIQAVNNQIRYLVEGQALMFAVISFFLISHNRSEKIKLVLVKIFIVLTAVGIAGYSVYFRSNFQLSTFRTIFENERIINSAILNNKPIFIFDSPQIDDKRIKIQINKMFSLIQTVYCVTCCNNCGQNNFNSLKLEVLSVKNFHTYIIISSEKKIEDYHNFFKENTNVTVATRRPLVVTEMSFGEFMKRRGISP